MPRMEAAFRGLLPLPCCPADLALARACRLPGLAAAASLCSRHPASRATPVSPVTPPAATPRTLPSPASASAFPSAASRACSWPAAAPLCFHVLSNASSAPARAPSSTWELPIFAAAPCPCSRTWLPPACATQRRNHPGEGTVGAQCPGQGGVAARAVSGVGQQAVGDGVSSPAGSHADSPGTRVAPDLLAVLRERGLVEAVTSEDLSKAAQSPLKVYVGFDPTAESLHLGNLLGIIALAWAVRCGHTAVALLGGATARVGDPSGKSAERPVLDEATIGSNTAGIERILRDILGRQEQAVGQGRVEIVNNYWWWKDVSLLGFLRDVGKYARVGTMMAKESVKKRLCSEEGMSFTEFTYQLLQGYDFVHLYRQLGVTVQMGGSDQWGNITAGTDLIRRLDPTPAPSPPRSTPAAGNGAPASGPLGDRSTEAASAAAGVGGEGAAQGDALGDAPARAFGVTWPLLLKSDGTKFGKSEGGAIWLSSACLSPYKFYQYVFGMPDADVIRFLRMLTFLEISEIEAIAEEMKCEGYKPNSAQRRLAEEVTRFVHGEEGLEEAVRATQALAPGAATALDAAMLEAIAEDVPSVVLPLAQVHGRPVVEVAASSGLVGSKGAGRRLVKQGGLYMNNVKVEGDEAVVGAGDLVEGRMLLLGAGKKNKMLIRIQQ